MRKIKFLSRSFLIFFFLALFAWGTVLSSALASVQEKNKDRLQGPASMKNGNCSYSYDPETKVLEITGTGSAIYVATDSHSIITDVDQLFPGNPSPKPAPIFPDCKKIIIGEGITEIELALPGFEALEEVEYPSTLSKTDTPFSFNSYKLRKIVNKSSASFSLKLFTYYANDERQRFEWNNDNYLKKGEVSKRFSPFTWKTEDGEIVDYCPAKSTITATPKTFKIGYDLNGGKKGKGKKWFYTYTYGTKKTLPIPVRPGYLFAGWMNAKTDNKYYETVVFSKVMPWRAGDVKLKALWRRIKVTKTKDSIDVYLGAEDYLDIALDITTVNASPIEIFNAPSDPNKNSADVLDEKRSKIIAGFYAGNGADRLKKSGSYMKLSIKPNPKEPFYDSFHRAKWKKGKTYYIWVKLGEDASWEQNYQEEDQAYFQSWENDLFYFYKAKIKF